MAKWFASDESTHLDAISLNGHADHASAHVTRQAATNVHDLMSVKNKGIVSVIGKLELISFRGGNLFNVYDQLWYRAVACRFPHQDLAIVKDALGARVRVRGIIYRNRRGQPLRVEKPILEPLPLEEELPSVDDLIGLDPNFTGRLGTGEYIEQLS